MNKFIIVIAASFVISGCNPIEPESTTKVGNDVALQKLFEKDGCTMYRFEDNGRKVYWSNCEGNVHSLWSSTNGKGVTTNHDDESMNTGGRRYEVP